MTCEHIFRGLYNSCTGPSNLMDAKALASGRRHKTPHRLPWCLHQQVASLSCGLSHGMRSRPSEFVSTFQLRLSGWNSTQTKGIFLFEQCRDLRFYRLTPRIQHSIRTFPFSSTEYMSISKEIKISRCYVKFARDEDGRAVQQYIVNCRTESYVLWTNVFDFSKFYVDHWASDV